MITPGNLNLRDRDQLDFPIAAITDNAAMLRLVGNVVKSFDNDVVASLDRIASDIDRGVTEIRAFFDDLQLRGAEKGEGRKRKVVSR